MPRRRSSPSRFVDKRISRAQSVDLRNRWTSVIYGTTELMYLEQMMMCRSARNIDIDVVRSLLTEAVA